MRDGAYKEMNFEKAYYYSYIPKTKEEGAKSEDFDKDSVKIVKRKDYSGQVRRNSNASTLSLSNKIDLARANI